MKVVGVILARYESKRFPGKPLADICGKPMIWWVYQRAKNANQLDCIIVATDHEKILDVCKEYDIPTLMTSPNHDTPTSRLYEVSSVYDGDLFVFIGGDEPLIDYKAIDSVIEEAEKKHADVTNAMTKIASAPEVIDFTNIKVVCNTLGFLLYCSRSPLPYPKGGLDFEYYKFVGIGAFTRFALQEYNKTQKTKLEIIEECDLIRFLEKGISVKMVEVGCKSISVDTPKDLEVVRAIIKEQM